MTLRGVAKGDSKMQSEKEKFKENFIKRLIKFSVDILNFSESIKSRRILWPIADQLIRSASSIGANVVEAKSSSSRRDYIHFFEIALKSANETKYWLIVIKESAIEFSEATIKLYNEADEISKVIGSSILTLKDKK